MTQRVLIYTLALDLPGTLDWRLMAKMLAGSLLRNYFAGTVRVVRNTEEPVFRLLREGLYRARGIAGRRKAEAAQLVEPGRWDSVIYLDADCVTLRGVKHLLEGEDWDIRYLPAGSDGANPSVWAVRSNLYHAVMEEWKRRMEDADDDWMVANATPPAPDGVAWSGLVQDCRSGDLPWRARRFEHHEILSPLRTAFTWQQCREAAVLHAAGVPVGERIEFLFAMYMQKYFSDPRGTLLNILEM